MFAAVNVIIQGSYIPLEFDLWKEGVKRQWGRALTHVLLLQGRLSLSTVGDKCAKDNSGGILLKV